MYHRKYIMCTPLILNGLCNNHTSFIAIVSFTCKVIEYKWTKKKTTTLEHISNASKYPRGINLIYKNNCQSNLKEMTSWGSTYFFHFCGRVSSKYWLLLRMWAELILLAANFPTRMTLMSDRRSIHRPKSHWANSGCQCRTDGYANVGPTSACYLGCWLKKVIHWWTNRKAYHWLPTVGH